MIEKALIDSDFHQNDGMLYREKGEKFPSTLWRGVRGEGLCRSGKRVAFTLAEVLITLGIIGVVAAMTIPTLVQQNQTRAWNTSAYVFELKLNEALKQMNTQQILKGYSTTEEFVDALGQYFKINKVCQNNDLRNCFEDTVTWGEEEVDMTKVKKVEQFGHDDWGTNLVGVQFANGTNGLIAYNPTKSCIQDPYDSQFDGSSCISLLYDTSGYTKPNTNGKDLRGINIISLGNGCVVEVAGLCITATAFTPTPHVFEACNNSNTPNANDQTFMSKYGINYCYYQTDYWAGAMQQCQDNGGRLPTMAELATIANYIYNTDTVIAKKDVGASYDGTTISWDTAKAAEFGFPASTFYVWSSEEVGPYGAYNRNFYSDRTWWRNLGRNDSNLKTICVGD